MTPHLSAEAAVVLSAFHQLGDADRRAVAAAISGAATATARRARAANIEQRNQRLAWLIAYQQLPAERPRDWRVIAQHLAQLEGTLGPTPAGRYAGRPVSAVALMQAFRRWRRSHPDAVGGAA